MSLPEVGSTVYAVLSLPLGQLGVDVFPVHVMYTFDNKDGVYGPWFSVQNAWQDCGFALCDEGLTWSRVGDTASCTALLASYALLRSC